MSSPVNYAQLFGFKSTAGAAVFAALWAPLCLWFFMLFLRYRTFVTFMLAVFCQVRLAAFVIRAILVSSTSAGENLSLFIADEVFFYAGYFGLLYGSFSLTRDRLALCHTQPFNNFLFNFFRSHFFFHITLSTGVILGVVGIVEASDHPSNSIGGVLRKVSVIIFVALTVWQAFLVLTLVVVERRDDPNERTKYIGTSFGARHGALICLAIAALLLVREIYTAATIGTLKDNEHLWYPLLALPELLCLILYAIPGLIPPKQAKVSGYV